VISPDEFKKVELEKSRLQAEVVRLNNIVSSMTSDMQSMKDRSAEWEKFFYEHKASRDEGYEAARARYWPKVEAARADVVLLRTALRKLLDAAREVPPTAALGSMIVNGDFVLERIDQKTSIPKT